MSKERARCPGTERITVGWVIVGKSGPNLVEEKRFVDSIKIVALDHGGIDVRLDNFRLNKVLESSVRGVLKI